MVSNLSFTGNPELDKARMIEKILAFPFQIRKATEIAEESFQRINFSFQQVKNIVFVGMGGSGIAGEIIRNYLSKELRIPVFTNQDYTLPSLWVQRRYFL